MDLKDENDNCKPFLPSPLMQILQMPVSPRESGNEEFAGCAVPQRSELRIQRLSSEVHFREVRNRI